MRNDQLLKSMQWSARDGAHEIGRPAHLYANRLPTDLFVSLIETSEVLTGIVFGQSHAK
jgi:hypothetical protein